MLATAVLSIAVQTSPRDVSAHVVAAEALAHRLVQSGFPDLRGWELHRVELPENTIVLDPLSLYVWSEPHGKSAHAYSVYGTKRPVPAKSAVIVVDDLVGHLFASTRFKDGTWYASGLDKALVSFVAAGHLDVVKRVIERDNLDRTAVDAFVVELLHGVAVPRFNEAVWEYQQGRYSSARAILAPLLDWLSTESPDLTGRQAEQRVERSRALHERTLALAGEVRRRLRAPIVAPFSGEQANSLTIERRILYLIEHLAESGAITMRPGGALFHLSPIGRTLVEIGEPALPALREVVGSDPRLTTVAYNRVDGDLLYVYSVADVARQIIRQIEGNDKPR